MPEEENEVKEIIADEPARTEITSWLDHKKVSPNRRSEKESAISKMVECIKDGTISIDSSTFVITQKLVFPIGKDGMIKILKWQPFGNTGKIAVNMKGVESGDFTGNCIAIAATQTAQPKTIINALDTEDLAIVKFIAIFFM